MLKHFLVVFLLTTGVVACQSNQSYTHGTLSSISLDVGPSEIGVETPSLDGTFETEDLKWVFLTVYGEVRNQETHEIEAVCQVIYNRLVSGLYGNTFKEVVLSPKQFSVWNKRGGQRRYLLRDDITLDTEYLRVKTICTSVLNERLKGVDTSLGINYFYHPQSMKPVCMKYKKFGKRKRTFKCTRWRKLPPKWAYNYEHKQRIGAGVFMRKAH